MTEAKTLEELQELREGHKWARTVFKVNRAAARTKAAKAIYEHLARERRVDAALLNAAMVTMAEADTTEAGRLDLAELQETVNQIKAELQQTEGGSEA